MTVQKRTGEKFHEAFFVQGGFTELHLHREHGVEDGLALLRYDVLTSWRASY